MASQEGITVWRAQVRLPQTMADFVKDRAKSNFRSMNAELVEIIREAMKREPAHAQAA